MRGFVLIGMALLLSACAVSSRIESGKTYPTFTGESHLGDIVGVEISDDSTDTQLGSTSVDDVASEFAQRLRNQKVFDVVIYPYSEHAKIDPDYVVTLKIDSTDDNNSVENMAKAVAIGASFFVLSPVLRMRFELNLGIEAKVYNPKKSLIGTYSYRDTYELQRNMWYADTDELNEFFEESVRHVVDNVVASMVADEQAFGGGVVASKTSAE